jgi:hypothetical protein
MAHHESQSCIDAGFRCAQECAHCAEACLEEDDVTMMAECIRLDQDCAEICWTASAFMSRGSQFAHDICSVGTDVCEACGAECRRMVGASV